MFLHKIIALYSFFPKVEGVDLHFWQAEGLFCKFLENLEISQIKHTLDLRTWLKRTPNLRRSVFLVSLDSHSRKDLP